MMMTMHANYYCCIHSVPDYNYTKLWVALWLDKMRDWLPQIQNNGNSLQKLTDQCNLNHKPAHIVEIVCHTSHHRIPVPMGCTNRRRAFAPAVLLAYSDYCYSNGLYCWCCLGHLRYYFVHSRRLDMPAFDFACMDWAWVEPQVHFVDYNNWPKHFHRAMSGRLLQPQLLLPRAAHSLHALHYFDAVSNGDGHNSAGNYLLSNNLNWNGPNRQRSH